MVDQLAPREDVTVIGAGIIGVCSALWLQRSNCNVTLIDKDEPGNGTSFGNTAMITPGQVVPQALPGLLKDVPRWLLSKRSPLKIRVSYLPVIAPWLWAFSRAGQVENAIGVSRALRALHGQTFELYEELVRGTPAQDFFEKCGHIHLTTAGAKSRSPELTGLLREIAGVKIEHLSQDDLRSMVPELAPIFKSGVLMPGNGRVRNPQRLVQTLADEAVRLGARFVKANVEGITLRDGRCESIRVGGQERSVGKLVIAAGMGSRMLTKQLGMRIPLETERGYHVTLPNPGFRPSKQVIVRDWGVGVGPIDDEMRAAGTVEFCDYNSAPDWTRADKILARVKEIFPSVNIEGAKRWMGDRPSISDGLAVLGKPERFRNIYFAFGNAQHGMTGGPMMGKVLSEIVTGRKTSIDPTPFNPDRFN